MKKWFKNLFKSRAQRDRERGYYRKLSGVDGSPAEQLDQLFRGKYTRTAKLKSWPLNTSWLERVQEYRRRYKSWPSLKEWLALFWPYEWLLEKLWPRWDPEDRNARKAPPAGYFDHITGTVYADPRKKIVLRRRR